MTEKGIVAFLQRGIKLDTQINMQYIRVKNWKEIDSATTEEAEKHISILKTELSQNMDKLVGIEAEIIKFIEESNLTDIEKTILEMRYLGYKRWGEIGEKLGYTEAYLWKIHRKSIKKLAQ